MKLHNNNTRITTVFVTKKGWGLCSIDSERGGGGGGGGGGGAFE